MRPRRILWLALFAAAAGAAFLALYSFSTPPLVVTLPDGMRLTVVRVTTSQHPKYCFGNPLQKLCSVLPGKAGEKLSGRTRFDGGTYARPALAIWFTRENIKNVWTCARITGEDAGTWSATRSLLTMSLGSNQEAGFIVAEAWPRRDKELKLQIKESRGDWVTFRIPNPEIVRCEQWDPESLPAARMLGDMEFVLQAVEVEAYPPFSKSLSNYDNKGPRMATLYVLVRERGQSTNSWQPATITLQDATGNSVPCVDWNPPALASSPLVPPNTIAWSGDWPAVPGENAVKVVVEFLRKTPSASAEGSTNAPRREVKLEWIVPAGGTITNIAAR